MVNIIIISKRIWNDITIMIYSAFKIITCMKKEWKWDLRRNGFTLKWPRRNVRVFLNEW